MRRRSKIKTERKAGRRMSGASSRRILIDRFSLFQKKVLPVLKKMYKKHRIITKMKKPCLFIRLCSEISWVQKIQSSTQIRLYLIKTMKSFIVLKPRYASRNKAPSQRELWRNIALKTQKISLNYGLKA